MNHLGIATTIYWEYSLEHYTPLGTLLNTTSKMVDIGNLSQNGATKNLLPNNQVLCLKEKKKHFIGNWYLNVTLSSVWHPNTSALGNNLALISSLKALVHI